MIDFLLQIFHISPYEFEPILRNCAIVSVIDYIGFNFVAYTLLKHYRYWHMIQYPMLFASGIFLWIQHGFFPALSFTILHGCFFNDWNFYGIGGLLNLQNGWENWKDLLKQLNSDEIEHSHWTFGYRLFKNATPRFVFKQTMVAIILVIVMKYGVDLFYYVY